MAGCGTVSTPAGWAAPVRLDDSQVLVQVRPGQVKAVDPATGAEIWHFPDDVKSEKVSSRNPRPLKGTLYANPVIDGPRVYIASFEGHVARIDRADGRIVNPWTVELKESVVATPILKDGRLYVPTESGNIIVVNTEDGAIVNRFATGAGRIWGSPVLAGDQIVVTNVDRGDAAALRLSDGGTVWQTKVSGPTSADIVRSGSSYLIGSFDRTLHALDGTTGAEVWRFAGDGWFTAAPLVTNDTIYAVTMRGTVYALDSAGVQRWSTTVAETEFRAAPVIANGTLVLVDRRGTLVGLDPATGQQRWKQTLEETRIDANPLVVGGNVLLTTSRHVLIRVDAATGSSQRFELGG